MSHQYIRFSEEELKEAQKTLLQSQLSSLTTLKQLQAYKKLRNQEFALKVTLKSRIDELMNDLKSFEKTLPAIPMPKENRGEIENVQNKIEKTHEMVQEIQMSSLDAELASLKERLARLQ